MADEQITESREQSFCRHLFGSDLKHRGLLSTLREGRAPEPRIGRILLRPTWFRGDQPTGTVEHL